MLKHRVSRKDSIPHSGNNRTRSTAPFRRNNSCTFTKKTKRLSRCDVYYSPAVNRSKSTDRRNGEKVPEKAGETQHQPKRLSRKDIFYSPADKRSKSTDRRNIQSCKRSCKKHHKRLSRYDIFYSPAIKRNTSTDRRRIKTSQENAGNEIQSDKGRLSRIDVLYSPAMKRSKSTDRRYYKSNRHTAKDIPSMRVSRKDIFYSPAINRSKSTDRRLIKTDKLDVRDNSKTRLSRYDMSYSPAIERSKSRDRRLKPTKNLERKEIAVVQPRTDEEVNSEVDDIHIEDRVKLGKPKSGCCKRRGKHVPLRKQKIRRRRERKMDEQQRQHLTSPIFTVLETLSEQQPLTCHLDNNNNANDDTKQSEESSKGVKQSRLPLMKRLWKKLDSFLEVKEAPGLRKDPFYRCRKLFWSKFKGYSKGVFGQPWQTRIIVNEEEMAEYLEYFDSIKDKDREGLIEEYKMVASEIKFNNQFIRHDSRVIHRLEKKMDKRLAIYYAGQKAREERVVNYYANKRREAMIEADLTKRRVFHCERTISAEMLQAENKVLQKALQDIIHSIEAYNEMKKVDKDKIESEIEDMKKELDNIPGEMKETQEELDEVKEQILQRKKKLIEKGLPVSPNISKYCFDGSVPLPPGIIASEELPVINLSVQMKMIMNGLGEEFAAHVYGPRKQNVNPMFYDRTPQMKPLEPIVEEVQEEKAVKAPVAFVFDMASEEEKQRRAKLSLKARKPPNLGKRYPTKKDIKCENKEHVSEEEHKPEDKQAVAFVIDMGNDDSMNMTQKPGHKDPGHSKLKITKYKKNSNKIIGPFKINANKPKIPKKTNKFNHIKSKINTYNIKKQVLETPGNDKTVVKNPKAITNTTTQKATCGPQSVHQVIAKKKTNKFSNVRSKINTYNVKKQVVTNEPLTNRADVNLAKQSQSKCGDNHSIVKVVGKPPLPPHKLTQAKNPTDQSGSTNRYQSLSVKKTQQPVTTRPTHNEKITHVAEDVKETDDKGPFKHRHDKKLLELCKASPVWVFRNHPKHATHRTKLPQPTPVIIGAARRLSERYLASRLVPGHVVHRRDYWRERYVVVPWAYTPLTELPKTYQRPVEKRPSKLPMSRVMLENKDKYRIKLPKGCKSKAEHKVTRPNTADSPRESIVPSDTSDNNMLVKNLDKEERNTPVTSVNVKSPVGQVGSKATKPVDSITPRQALKSVGSAKHGAKTSSQIAIDKSKRGAKVAGRSSSFTTKPTKDTKTKASTKRKVNTVRGSNAVQNLTQTNNSQPRKYVQKELPLSPSVPGKQKLSVHEKEGQVGDRSSPKPKREKLPPQRNTPTNDNSHLLPARRTPNSSNVNSPLPPIRGSPTSNNVGTPLPAIRNTPVGDNVSSPLPPIRRTPTNDVIGTPLQAIRRTPVGNNVGSPRPSICCTPTTDKRSTPLPPYCITPTSKNVGTPLPPIRRTSAGDNVNTPLPSIRHVLTPVNNIVGSPVPLTCRTPAGDNFSSCLPSGRGTPTKDSNTSLLSPIRRTSTKANVSSPLPPIRSTPTKGRVNSPLPPIRRTPTNGKVGSSLSPILRTSSNGYYGSPLPPIPRTPPIESAGLPLPPIRCTPISDKADSPLPVGQYSNPMDDGLNMGCFQTKSELPRTPIPGQKQ